MSEHELRIEDIEVPAVIFKITKTYKPGMMKDEIYDAGRRIWRIDWRSHNPEYAIITAFGKVLGTFRITGWEPAKTERLDVAPEGRWEFRGEWADEFNMYRGQEISLLPGSSTTGPFFYVNC